MKRTLIQYAKNWPGKSTGRKLVIFAVDDFGNVFLHNKQARTNLEKAGLPVSATRFTQYDGLENTQDLALLFEVLHSVKDQHGHPAVFTPFALPVNIAFEQMAAAGHTAYQYELLPDTLGRLPGYEGAWALWQEGMAKGFFVPQFHGREHLNLRLFNWLLERRDPELMACLENRSFAALTWRPEVPVGYTEAFSFHQLDETEAHKAIIRDGLAQFERVFGYKAVHFNAPGAREHHSLAETLHENGIRMMDTDVVKNEHQGAGRYRRSYHPFGQKNAFGQYLIFRNAIFEPSIEGRDWVDSCLNDMQIAFNCGKPAHISSHRVNFTSCVEPSVRDHGLRELARLLKAIVHKWPDAEFVATPTIYQLLSNA